MAGRKFGGFRVDVGATFAGKGYRLFRDMNFFRRTAGHQ